MATPPIICASDGANELIERAYFDKCTLTVIKGNNTVNTLSLCDFSMDISNFFSQSLRLKGNTAFLLDDGEIGLINGEIKFIVIKVSYPSTFTNYADKYINLNYIDSTYPIGELNIWTGNPKDGYTGRGIKVTTPSGEYTSPYFNSGGIVIHNPHSNYVDMDVMIAY